MNRSRRVLTQSASFTEGGAIARIGWKAQWGSDWKRADGFGQGEPALTHAVRSVTSRGESALSGGMAETSGSLRIAWISRLSAGSSTSIAGPLSPPSIRDARVSMRRPPLTFCPPWHRKQVPARMGRTRFSKYDSERTSSACAEFPGAPTTRSPASRAHTARTFARDKTRPPRAARSRRRSGRGGRSSCPSSTGRDGTSGGSDCCDSRGLGLPEFGLRHVPAG